MWHSPLLMFLDKEIKLLNVLILKEHIQVFFFGIPASGRKVDIDGVTLVKMKDRKIAQEQDFLDNLSFYQQLGLIPVE